MPEAQQRDGRVLVLGGAGFVGSHITHRLLSDGFSVRVLARRPAERGRQPLIAGAEVVVGDTSNLTDLIPALDGVQHVIYAVGALFPAQSNLDPLRDATLTLTPLLTVLEALRKRPGVGFTFISSGGTVYGNVTALPVSEDVPPEPITSYGVMKLAGEKYVSMYGSLYDIHVRILRVSNAYGPGQPDDRGQGAVAAFLRKASRQEPLPLFGDGSVVRDFIHVTDIASVVSALVGRRDGPRVLNVGAGTGHSMAHLVEIIRDVTGRVLEIQRLPDRAFDVRAVVLDVTRLRELVSFPERPLRQGVAETWAAVQAGALAHVSTESMSGAVEVSGPASQLGTPSA